MATPAGELLIKLAMDMADFTSDMNKAVTHIDRFTDRVQGAAQKLAALATTGSLAVLVKNTVDADAHLDNLSKSTSLAVETLSSLERTAYIGGHSLDLIATGASRFAKSVAEANGGNQLLIKSFEALGFSQDDLKSKKFDELYVDLAKKIATADNQQNAIALATKLAGKSAAEAIPFWKELAQSGLEQAHTSAEQAAAAQKLEAETRRLMLAQRDAKDELVREFIPGMTDWIQTNSEAIKIAGGLAEMLRLFVFNLEGFSTENPRAQIERLTKKLQDYRSAQLSILGFKLPENDLTRSISQFGQSPTGKIFGGREEDLQKQIELAKFMERQDALRKTGPEFLDARDLMAHPAISTKVGTPPNEALIKQQTAALQAMEEKKHSLFNLTEEELMLQRVLNGTYKEFDSETKVRLLNFALEIDARKQLIQRIDAEYGSLTTLLEGYEKLLDAQRDFRNADKLALGNLAHSTSNIGKTAPEQERADALRQIDQDAITRANQVGMMLGVEGEGAKAISKIYADAAIQKAKFGAALDVKQEKERAEIMRQNIELIQTDTAMLTMSRREQEKLQAIRASEVQQFGKVLSEEDRARLLTEQDIAKRKELIAVIEQRQAVERAWQTGAVQGLHEYADAATDMAAMTKNAFLDAFKGMEDVLVNFIKTGKLNFRDFATSVVDDMARMFVRSQITGPIADAIGGMFKTGVGSATGAAQGAGLKVLEASAVSAGTALTEIEASAVTVSTGLTSLEATTYAVGTGLTSLEATALSADTGLAALQASTLNATTALDALAASAGTAGGAEASGAGGGLIKLLGGGASSSSAGIEAGAGEAMLWAAFADGGRPPVGVPSMVGERGPELFVPDVAGTIVPNHELGGGGVSLTQNLYFNPATPAATREVVYSMLPTIGDAGRRAVQDARGRGRR